MLRNTIGKIILLGLLTGTFSAFADEPLKREVFGSIGWGLNYDDEGSIGSGITGGGGFGYRIWQRFGVEGEVNAFRSKREFASISPPFRMDGVRVMGNGLLYLNRGVAQSYLLFGGGLTHVRNKFNFAGVNAKDSSTGASVAAGFGVRIFLTPHISLRPEFRLEAAPANGAIEAPFTSIRFSTAIGYHW